MENNYNDWLWSIIDQDLAKEELEELNNKTNNNMKHTKGPWHVYKMGNYFGIDAGSGGGYGKDDKTIVTFGDSDDDLMGVRGDTHEEMHANAKLIAAAPELLEALQSIIADPSILDGASAHQTMQKYPVTNHLKIAGDKYAKIIESIKKATE